MAITSALVLYLVLWFMVFFVALPIRIKTQGDLDNVVPGTPSSAPEQHHLKKKAIITTIIAGILWAVIAGIILSGWVTVSTLGWNK